MANRSIFSECYRSTIIQYFHLRNLSELLERYFYPCANSWNYIAIGGVARTVQKSPKFAILYGKMSGVQWDPARSTVRELDRKAENYFSVFASAGQPRPATSSIR